MKKHVLTLTTSAIILVWSAIVASAQQSPGPNGPGTQQGAATQQNPAGPTVQQQPAQQGTAQQGTAQQGMAQQGTAQERMWESVRRAQRDENEARDDDDYGRYGRRMMGPYGRAMEDEDRDRYEYCRHGRKNDGSVWPRNDWLELR